jgi:hypothetical protein
LTIRSTRTTVSFKNPFTPEGGARSAVLIDDELIEELSRIAYRRLVTLFQTLAISASKRKVELVSVSQTELDAAFMKDRCQTIAMH